MPVQQDLDKHCRVLQPPSTASLPASSPGLAAGLTPFSLRGWVVGGALPSLASAKFLFVPDVDTVATGGVRGGGGGEGGGKG